MTPSWVKTYFPVTRTNLLTLVSRVKEMSRNGARRTVCRYRRPCSELSLWILLFDEVELVLVNLFLFFIRLYPGYY